jgi:chitodextrinase
VVTTVTTGATTGGQNRGAVPRSLPFALVLLAAATHAPAQTAESDFAARCAQPAVVKCVGFDTAADVSGGYGSNSGIFPSSGNANVFPTLDAAVKASGPSALRFTVPSRSGADTSGAYFTNFSPDLSVQFGENSDFYVQWRQRFTPEFAATEYAGGGGWKQTIIGSGDQPGGILHFSCSDLEVVTVNGYYRGFTQMYNSCSGSASHGPYDGFEEPFGAYDYKLQNARLSPYCLYSQTHTSPSTAFPPSGNCFGHFPDEWMTFQVHIRTGPRQGDEFVGSLVELWIAREGQPSELAIRWGPYNLSAGSPGEGQKFGKVWLLPYNTGKDSSVAYPETYTWYDELIVSRERIADPGADAPPPPEPDTAPPTAPAGLSATAVSSSQIDLSWRASTDDVAVTGYRVYRCQNAPAPRGRGGLGVPRRSDCRPTVQVATVTGTSHQDTGLSPSTTYVYRVRAHDAAGNLSSSSRRARATTRARPPGTSALAVLAGSLAPGQWASLSTADIDPTLTNTGGSSNMIFGYADAMKWDPVSRRMLYLGSDHGGHATPGPNSTHRFVAYSEDTNAWSVLPTPPWASTNPVTGSYTDVHGYDKTAIHPQARRLYRNPFNSKRIHVYDLDTGAWSQLPDPPNTGSSCCDAIEYFPELGGLVWSQGTGTQLFFSDASQQWSPLGTEASLASTWMFAEHNPVHGVTILGSSTGALFALSSSGQLDRLGNIPVTIYDGSAWNGVVTLDPVSGDFLVLTPPTRQLHVYDVVTDTWRPSPHAPPAPGMNAVLGTPIAAYGVTAFTHCNNRGTCGVWLYRHAGE